MSRIRFDNVTKIYQPGTADEEQALTDFSLEVEDGEFLVLVGPSGCGKTTTLRLLAGLDDVTRGRIWIDEQEITHLTPAERDVAMVFQNYALYPHKTVRGNIAAGLQYSTDLDREEIRPRVKRTARLLDIPDLLDNKPDELSGGQKQRVALGRAIIRQPRVFLFDEPLSNLDAKLRREMRAEIIQLQQQLGVTTVYVTHDQEEAMTMADTIAVMRDGILQQVGRSMDVYDNPNNRFVAKFIGSPSMNFLPITPVHHGEKLEFESTDSTDLSPAWPTARLTADSPPRGEDPCRMGVRPENLRLNPGREQDCDYEIEATIRVVEPLGNSTLVHVQFEEQNWKILTGKNSDLEPEQRIRIGFDRGDVHLFGPAGDALLDFN